MKKVVVIGGGFTGSTVAKKLENEFDVTLIDNKEYFEFTPGILRTIVHPTQTRCIQVKHKDYLKNSNVIIGKADKIGDKFVSVNKKKIKYDYLVLAMGSSYVAPFKHPKLFAASRSKELAVYNRYLVDGKNILIIGGGLVGVELAGEIGYYYCGKKITIVASGEHLLDRMPLKAQEYAEKVLKEMGVEIIFNDKVVKQKNNVFITEKGKKMNGEVGFTCVGISPNTSLLNKMNGILDERRFVYVDENLRVKGMNNVFAGGDITNIREEKTGQNAEKHAQVIAKNIRRFEQRKELTSYKHKSSPIVISLGPRKGILIMGNFVLTGIIPAILKWIVEKKELLKKKI
ncbi:MAG TPA: FAD-dependent oxidoreductase [Candidatus Nanoarchaeia archaeon]|nr:FAD-dependent oxidoreductase [Candidatus Nanoarchaeia archaeon]